jgi:hypothetical protein
MEPTNREHRGYQIHRQERKNKTIPPGYDYTGYDPTTKKGTKIRASEAEVIADINKALGATEEEMQAETDRKRKFALYLRVGKGEHVKCPEEGCVEILQKTKEGMFVVFCPLHGKGVVGGPFAM